MKTVQDGLIAHLLTSDVGLGTVKAYAGEILEAARNPTILSELMPAALITVPLARMEDERGDYRVDILICTQTVTLGVQDNALDAAALTEAVARWLFLNFRFATPDGNCYDVSRAQPVEAETLLLTNSHTVIRARIEVQELVDAFTPVPDPITLPEFSVVAPLEYDVETLTLKIADGAPATPHLVWNGANWVPGAVSFDDLSDAPTAMTQEDGEAGVNNTPQLIAASVLAAVIATLGGGGGGTPGGSNGQVQYNNAGAFGGAFSWDHANKIITLVNALTGTTDQPKIILNRSHSLTGSGQYVGTIEWSHPNAGGGGIAARIRVETANASGSKSVIRIYTNDGSGLVLALSIGSDGLFGFGTTSPAATISVGSLANSLPTDGNGNGLHSSGQVIAGNAQNNYLLALLNDQNKGRGLLIQSGNDSNARDVLRLEDRLKNLLFTVLSNGYLGLGVEPTSPLHVGGASQFDADQTFSNIGDGPIIRSPDGTYWRIEVDNAGNLSTTSI